MNATRPDDEPGQARILEALQNALHPSRPNCMRVGLVLNGTVSAGAWTAGALDALIEALDLFYEARREERTHDVQVEILGGASGGSVCAALFAKAVQYRFPPARSFVSNPGNPFWETWVETLDAKDMIVPLPRWATGRDMSSLLSGRAIAAAADSILRWEGEPLDARRPWLAPGLRVLMTQTNLSGVPYEMKLQGSDTRHTRFVSHADHVAFVVDDGTTAAIRPRGDEFVLPKPHGVGAATAWRRLADNARASGAFPVGFPPVRLDRPRAHYDWRAVVLPGARIAGVRGSDTLELLRPAWPAKSPAEYVYTAVDGGALNNSPFQLVHNRMAGILNSFPRSSLDADATIIVFDPLAASEPLPDLVRDFSAVKALGALVNALVAHGRYTASELLLASDRDVESRHLFTAARRPTGPAASMRARLSSPGNDFWGADALCTSGLGAFLGFVDRRYRVHDFHLGRRNMLAWLTKHFVLPNTSRLFAGRGLQPGDYPIVPLGGSLAVPQQPEWPSRRASHFYLARLAARRFGGVASLLAGLGLSAGVLLRPSLRKTIGALLNDALDSVDARR